MRKWAFIPPHDCFYIHLNNVLISPEDFVCFMYHVMQMSSYPQDTMQKINIERNMNSFHNKKSRVK